MKRVIPIALLPVFLYSIIGWQWIFFLQIYSHEMNELNNFSGDESDLVVLQLCETNPEGLVFLNAHEIMHNGKLYDVKFRENRGAYTLLYCRHDGGEENLFAAFDLKVKDCFGYENQGSQKMPKVIKVSAFENTKRMASVNAQLHVVTMMQTDETLFRQFPFVNSFFVPPDAV